MKLKEKRVGLALTGSFCTFSVAIVILQEIINEGAVVTPIISNIVDTVDTRFFKANDLKKTLENLSGNKVIRCITDAEPIGPRQLLDILVVLPCTGNTIAKMAMGISDTTVTMAVKSHLRNNRPVVLGVSTNDSLGNGAKNIGALLNAKNIYFVPFGQDDPNNKTRSMVLKSGLAVKTIEMALDGQQIQPILVSH
jgi:dipicolinate synthase subunit B